MNDDPSYEIFIEVDPAHPALAGHFPGNPVLPGVVVLDQVACAAEAWLGRPLMIAGLPQVKFVAPLLPGHRARIRLRHEPGRIDFEVDREGTTVARGVLRLAAEAGAP